MRQRLPGFLRESPADGDVTRKVKRAAGALDKFSIRLGVFLRRYPIARVMVIVYMVSELNEALSKEQTYLHSICFNMWISFFMILLRSILLLNWFTQEYIIDYCTDFSGYSSHLGIDSSDDLSARNAHNGL